MPNESSQNHKDSKKSDPRHGAPEVGNQDGTGAQVSGAFGGSGGVEINAGTAGSQTTGPMGDKDATQDVDNALRKSRERDAD